MAQQMKGMPREVQSIHDDLWQKVASAYAKWTLFCQLFASSEENVQLLNRAAPVFFYLYENSALDEILLTISRLTDPATSRVKGSDRDNLTLRQLEKQVNKVADKQFSERVNIALTKVEDQCAFARELRNRKIAHLDLFTHQGKGANPLPLVNKTKIEGALRAIQDFMNLIEEHFSGSTTAYSDLFLSGDGNTLLDRLRDAETYRKT